MTDDLQAEQVAQWLGKHPYFFTNHPELLSELRIPHQAGTVSLLEYQAQLLREENSKLHTQLTQLTQTAHRNDGLFHALRKLLLALLAAQTLDEWLQALQRGLQKEFQVPRVGLMLFSEAPLNADCRQLPLKQARVAIGALLKGNAQLCSALRDSELDFLFGKHSEVKSAAVLPLRGDDLYGLLALGSPDPERYRGTLSTLFLDYLGEVLPCLLKRFLPAQAH